MKNMSKKFLENHEMKFSKTCILHAFSTIYFIQGASKVKQLFKQHFYQPIDY